MKCTNNNQIFMNEKITIVGSVPSWYIDQKQHTEIICTILASEPEKKSVRSSGCGVSCHSMANNALTNINSPENLFREGYNNGMYLGRWF